MISCTQGQIGNDTPKNLLRSEENKLWGKIEDDELGRAEMDTAIMPQRDLAKTTNASVAKKTDSTTVREGRSHVSEAEPGMKLGKKEELLDSDAVTSDPQKASSVASTKKIQTTKKTTTGASSKPDVKVSTTASTETKKAASAETKKASTGTTKATSSDGKTSSSNGTIKSNGNSTSTKKSTSSEKGELATSTAATTKSEASSSYSSGVYAPSICGKSRKDVEAICNTDLPICKYQTMQATGHEPFHITTTLRPNQGDCIRRCDSKWGLSDKHCVNDEECHVGVETCTKCALLNKRGCEAF